MFCENCGTPLQDNDQVCTECGDRVNQVCTPIKDDSAATERASILWCVVGFCVPIVGLIIYLLWKDIKPRAAKYAGVGALTSVIVGTIVYVVATLHMVALVTLL